MDGVALFLVGLMAGIAAAALALAIRDARPGRQQNATSALRCSICGVDWPPDPHDYGRCPTCLEQTYPVGGGVRPLDSTQARSIRLHREFERFYSAWKGEDAA